MFDFVRSNNRVIQIVMGVVLVVFALAGGGSAYQFFRQGNESVAEVDGREISRAEWDNQHRQAVDQMRQRNPNVDLRQLDTPEARRASLESVVKNHVLQAAEFHENLVPSDERTLSAFKTYPQFEQVRAIPRDQLKMLLAQQGKTLDGYFESIKDELGKLQVLNGVASSQVDPKTDANAALGAWFEQRDIQWQRFDVKDYAAQIQPTEEQVKAYYDDKAHAAEFKAPEEAKIEYVVFSVETLKPQMPVSADEVQHYYEQNKNRYAVAEERRASHILVAVAQNAPADVVAKAKAKADALLAEVRKNPASFADVAKKDSDDVATKDEGGDLDYLTPKTAPPGAFADALFKLKQGEISDVVRSQAGFHIIEMTGTRGGGVRPFEEVRPQIEDQLRTQLAQKAYASGADKFSNTVYEQPNALPDQVKDDNATYKLAKQTATVQRKPDAKATGPLASTRLLDAVFGHDAVQDKHNTEAIDVGNSQLVSAHVVDYHPARARPLAEVHDQVVAALRQQLAAAAAKKDGEAKVAAAQKDAALALPQTATVGRATQVADVPRPVIDIALRTDLSKGPKVVGVALPDGGYAAVRVLKVVPLKPDDPAAVQARAQIGNAFSEAEQQAVYESLKVRYKAKVDDKVVARGPEDAASGAAN